MSASNDIMLLNFIDFELLTETNLKADLFDLPVQGAYRQAIENALHAYTDVTFQGETAWDLIVFVFQRVWNEMLSVGYIDVEVTSIGGKRTILLDYNGTSELGFVSFSAIGTKAALIFNVAKSSSWTNTTIFKNSIFTFVSTFLEPLKDILHPACFNQYPILASGTQPGHLIFTTQAGTYLEREAFVDFADDVLGAIPYPTFPIEITPSQIFFTLGVCLMVVFIVYYAYSSYKKEQQRIHQSSNESA
nr:hypothetical protein [Candidatus Sigynarchaeota archaeon]